MTCPPFNYLFYYDKISEEATIIMKHPLTIALIVSMTWALSIPAWSGKWSYDFGTGNDKSYTHASTMSTDFLPNPTDGNAKALVAVGNAGGGFYLQTGANPFNNSGRYYLKMVCASNNESPNKFSVFDYAAGSSGWVKFIFRYELSDSGELVESHAGMFFAGKGNSFSNNNPVENGQVFSGIRWSPYLVTNLHTQYLSGGDWVTLSTNLFNRNQNYTIEVMMNNFSSITSYTKGGSAYSLTAHKWDLWLANSRVGTNLTKGGLENQTAIDDFMFYGVGERHDTDLDQVIMYIDSIQNYGNDVTQAPVTVSQFVAD